MEHVMTTIAFKLCAYPTNTTTALRYEKHIPAWKALMNMTTAKHMKCMFKFEKLNYYDDNLKIWKAHLSWSSSN